MQKRKTFKRFTLSQIVIILAISVASAAVAIPKFSRINEAKALHSLKSHLSTVRDAIQKYRIDHNKRVPGRFNIKNGKVKTLTESEAAKAFVAQLTRYTDINGKVSHRKSVIFQYGPYLDYINLPANPFKDGTNTAKLLVSKNESRNKLLLSADGSTGWKYYLLQDVFISNDNIIFSDGTHTLDF